MKAICTKLKFYTNYYIFTITTLYIILSNLILTIHHFLPENCELKNQKKTIAF